MGLKKQKTTFALTGLALWGAAIVGPVAGQTSQVPPPPTAPSQTPGATAAGPVESEPYTYRPDGRRDPFVSLLSRGVEPAGVPRGSISGIGGLTTAELSVRGIVTAKGRYIAMVQGPDAKTYIAHPNDRLVDGVITRITAQGVVILQEVNDPLSLVKQREVRKNLRSAEEGK
jgi:hypothetical protein